MLAVLETGSLSGASRKLRLTQPTVRRQIEALEKELGAKLFTKTSAGLQPTDAAIGARRSADEMARAAGALVRAASGSDVDVAGTVRIACSEVVGVELLPSHMADLAEKHPQLQFEIHVSNVDDDIVRREADVAIRMHRPTQVGLLARRIGTLAVGLHASPMYLSNRKPPVRLEDLCGHILVGQERETSILDALRSAGLEQSQAFVFRTDNDLAQLALIKAGAGIGACQCSLGEKAGLHRVLPDLEMAMEVWLTMHEDLGRVARYRVVFDHLTRLLEHQSL